MSAKNNTKDLLADSLRTLMEQKPFSKITIKQICDQTGVIRIVFYNYFADKYEALEYIIYRDIYETALPYIENKQFQDALKIILYIVQENIEFYRTGYQIVGQNGFEECMNNVIYQLVKKAAENINEQIDISKNNDFMFKSFIKYHTMIINTGIKEYIKSDPPINPDFLINLYKWLILTSEKIIENQE